MKGIVGAMMSVMVAASGCLGGDAPGPQQADADPSKGTDNGTNVIYFGAASESSLLPPNGTTPVAISHSSTTPFLWAAQTAWEYTVANAATISGGKLVVFVHVVEPTLHIGMLVGGNGECTWRMDLMHEGESLYNDDTPCLAAAPGPMMGDIKVEFDFRLPAKTKIAANESIVFEFLSFTSSSTARPTLEIYAGAENFPSHVSLKGLNEAMPSPAMEPN